MHRHADADDLRLDALTASAGGWRIGIAIRANSLQPDRYVNLTPDQAMQLGEWMVERAKARGAVSKAINTDRIEF
ncbi:hypothetical protein ACU4GR_01480 [Methylobacterium oryzae CBMB20]